MQKCPIDELARQKGLNRAQLSRQAGISYSTLAKIAEGKVRKMRTKTLEPLSRFFEMDENALQQAYNNWIEDLKIV